MKYVKVCKRVYYMYECRQVIFKCIHVKIRHANPRKIYFFKFESHSALNRFYLDKCQILYIYTFYTLIEKKICVQDKIVFNRHKIFQPILEFNHQTLMYLCLLFEDRLTLLILYYAQVLVCVMSLNFQSTLLKAYYLGIFSV